MSAPAPEHVDMAMRAVELVGLDPMFRVFPLHGIDPATRLCTCGGGPKCAPGKHPWLRWQASVTSDRAQVLKLFDKRHAMNVAIATGQGLVVVDVDVDPAKGLDGFASLAAAGIDLDATPTRTARTGRGGKHYFFRSSEEIAGSISSLAKGVDVKAYGGYVVAPPSLHASGHRYEWLTHGPIADLPGELLAVLGRRKQSALRPASAVTFTGAARARAIEALARRLLAMGIEDPAPFAALENQARCEPPLAAEELAEALAPTANVRPGAVRLRPVVNDGGRNNALASAAGSLVRVGFSEPVVILLLLAENARRIVPPLGEDEVETIARSVARHAPADPYYAGLETFEAGVEDQAWAERLTRKPDTKEGLPGGLLPTLLNARVILAHDPRWRDVLGFDELAEELAIRREPPWLPEDRDPGAKLPRYWTDVDGSRLNMWLDSAHALRVPTQIAEAAAQAVAAGKPFDAVKDYLDGLSWDGIPRLTTWLETYARATGPEIIRRGVGRMWMISAVARTFEPGCQADYMLVLEGDQGARKSSVLRELAPIRHVFSDTPLDLGAKDALQGLRGRWIVEMAELKSVKGAHSIDAVKAFLTSRRDDYRSSYGRTVRSHERRCVFAGTVNPTLGLGYLSDPSGARRFWPVPVGDVDVEALRRDRDQLWAEAVAAYLDGEPCYPTRGGALELALIDAQDERTEYDENTTTIALWLASPLGLKALDAKTPSPVGFLSVTEVATSALGIAQDRVTRGAQDAVRRALGLLGWRSTPVRYQRTQLRFWAPPTN